MEKSLWNTYEKEYSNRVSKMLENIHQLEDEILNIKIEYSGPNKSHEIIIKFKYSNEIMLYFKYSNGSIGYDMYIIRSLLYSLLCYVYIAQEKNLTNAEQDTCSLEIERNFYFLLSCIYNLKEKYEKFFNIIGRRKNKIDLNKSVLTQLGKDSVLELNSKFYKVIKDYCLARDYIVHDIYTLKYDISTNNILVSHSIFDLSNDQLINKKQDRMVFNLEDRKLVRLVEEIQKIRKKAVEILSNINNIDLEKLTRKFLDEKRETIIVKG